MRFLNVLMAVVVLFFLSNCKKDPVEKPIEEPKPAPLLTTNFPVVFEDSVEFSAEFKNLDDQKILKYGFVWSQHSNPTQEDEIGLFNEEPQNGVFSLAVKKGFLKGQTYYVRAYILTDEKELYGGLRSFISKGSMPPVITSFTPAYGPIGTKVTIEGEYFSLKTGNSVKFGNIACTVDSVWENKLIVTVPSITKRESVTLSVQTDGKKGTSAATFDMWFPWVKKEPAPFNFNNAKATLANNKIYFYLGSNNDFWEYDPQTEIFTQKAKFPGRFRRFTMSFSCNNKCYYGLGSTVGLESDLNDLWEYNPETDQWTQKSSFPGRLRIFAISFDINNKGYFGSGEYWENTWNYYITDFWEYNPDTDQWLKKADLPQNRAGGFGLSIGSNAIAGFGSTGLSIGGIYKYDQLAENWSYVGLYPGKGSNYMGGFSIDNYVYVGLGSNNSSDLFSDFWRFDPTDYTWKQMRSCPDKFCPEFGVVVNNKGYMGDGTLFYEFDPTLN